MFFGTPHDESSLIICVALLSQSIGITKQTDMQIVKAAFMSDSEAVARIQDDFDSIVVARRNEGQPIDIACFYEQFPLAGVFSVCVPCKLVPLQNANVLA